MPHISQGYALKDYNNTIPLPNNVGDPDPSCEGGEIWTNLTAKELHICLGGADQHVVQSGYERCSVTKSTDQLIPKLVWTDVTWNQEDYDPNVAIHDTVTNNERVTVMRTGYYVVSYQVDWQTKKDVDFQVRIYKNGTTTVKQKCIYSPKDDIDLCMGETVFIYLTANDYITLQAYDGSAVDRYVRAAKSYLQVTLVFSDPVA